MPAHVTETSTLLKWGEFSVNRFTFEKSSKFSEVLTCCRQVVVTQCRGLHVQIVLGAAAARSPTCRCELAKFSCCSVSSTSSYVHWTYSARRSGLSAERLPVRVYLYTTVLAASRSLTGSVCSHYLATWHGPVLLFVWWITYRRKQSITTTRISAVSQKFLRFVICACDSSSYDRHTAR